MDAPVIDRATFEKLFGVRRRRAIQLLHFFGGYQADRTFLLDRRELLRQLEPLAASAEFALEQWKQGAELWQHVEVPAVRMEDGRLVELGSTELLPHRPDAFFTLHFPKNPPEKQHSHFLYEADRGTENTTRFKMKLRGTSSSSRTAREARVPTTSTASVPC